MSDKMQEIMSIGIPFNAATTKCRLFHDREDLDFSNMDAQQDDIVMFRCVLSFLPEYKYILGYGRVWRYGVEFGFTNSVDCLRFMNRYPEVFGKDEISKMINND